MKENPLVFPKKQDQVRTQKYEHYDQLYNGNHYSAFQMTADKEVRERYARLRYIVSNFAGLMTRVMADMLFGEPVSIDVVNKDNQKFITELLEQNQLFTQLYEAALASGSRGDSCFKVRVGPRSSNDPKAPSSIIIEEFSAAFYFPTLQADAARFAPKEDVFAYVFQRDGLTYLHKEIHTPGMIINEVWGYNPTEKTLTARLKPEDFGFAQEQPTGASRSLIFHVPNIRDGEGGYWGSSDYKDLDSLFFALNNRMTSVDNILDKHSDPILAVPPGVLDENGKVNKKSLQMFEVDNESPGFNKPEYIVWNANIDSAFKQVDKLVEHLFLFSEISPASASSDQGGNAAESGRALKIKLLATIRKKNRKQRYYDQMLKDLLETAQELAVFHEITMGDVKIKAPERPNIKWPDGVINDNVEETELNGMRIDQGTLSRADAISRMDGVPIEDAKKKVKEIDDEAGPDLAPPTNDINGQGTGGVGVTPPPTPQAPPEVKPPVPPQKPPAKA